MISVTTIGLTGSSVTFVSEITVPLSSYPVTSTPQYSIEYKAGEPIKSGTIYVVPIKAYGTVVYQPKGAMSPQTKIVNEVATIGFVSAAAPTGVTLASTSVRSLPTDVKCCQSKGIKITSTLSLTYVTA